LIFPDLQSCNIACKLLGTLGGAETVGPILAGMAKSVHLVQRGAEVEEIVNIATIAVVDAQDSSIPEGTRVASAVASVG
jgi:malate dehydrogenase (oxaloacetate-decarboxylating)(NADP+)